MNLIESSVLVLHLLTAIAICGFVLLQHGKGADMGAAFGSGSSGSLFGASGSANFLSRTTAILAGVFFLSSIGLTYFGSTRGAPQGTVIERSIMDQAPPSKAADIPTSTPPAAPPASGPAPAPGPGGSKSGDIPK